MTWVIEQISTDEPGVAETDWDTWNVGLVENDRFRVIYSCFAEADAVRLKTALEWFEQFEKGNIRPAVVPPKKRPARKAPAKKPASK